jgi:hypothetical protein
VLLRSLERLGDLLAVVAAGEGGELGRCPVIVEPEGAGLPADLARAHGREAGLQLADFSSRPLAWAASWCGMWVSLGRAWPRLMR